MDDEPIGTAMDERKPPIPLGPKNHQVEIVWADKKEDDPQLIIFCQDINYLTDGIAEIVFSSRERSWLSPQYYRALNIIDLEIES